MSLRDLMEDPTLPDSIKRAAFARASAGSKREYYYERYVRDPAHREVSGLIDRGPLGLVTGPGKKSKEGNWLDRLPEKTANWVVPSDLESAGELAGGALGTRYLGALGGAIGTEVGGIVGGRAMGRGWADSAWDAALPAATNLVAPWLIKKGANLAGSLYDKAVSSRASAQIAGATKKLFRRLLDNPEVAAKWPKTATEIADFFGMEGASPAMQEATENYTRIARVLRTQPAYRRVVVSVPVVSVDPVTNMPVNAHVRMTLPDALDYLKWLNSKGRSLSGAPRGSIGAIADRAVAAETRLNILERLRAVPGSGPTAAKWFEEASRDYGVAATLGDILTKKDTQTANGLLNHEQIWENAGKPHVISHLNALVGPDDTNQFYRDIFPDNQRIADPVEQHTRAGVGKVHFNVVPPSVNAPTQFQPWWYKQASPVAGYAVGQAVER